MSKYVFLRKYRNRYGLTPHSSLTDARIRQSLSLMREGGSLTDIALDCGFSDQSHFIRQFKRYTGIRPSKYRKAILSNRSGTGIR
jgi:AraC-like DNA-binding protein